MTEVYPAAALARWGFVKGHKGKQTRATPALVDAVAGATHGWLTFTADQQALCVENDNALDSLIASLVGRAAMKGLTE